MRVAATLVVLSLAGCAHLTEHAIVMEYTGHFSGQFNLTQTMSEARRLGFSTPGPNGQLGMNNTSPCMRIAVQDDSSGEWNLLVHCEKIGSPTSASGLSETAEVAQTRNITAPLATSIITTMGSDLNWTSTGSISIQSTIVRSSNQSEHAGSAALLLWSGAPTTNADFSVNWSYGVASIDFESGAGIGMTKADLEHGVHASIYPLPAASAGVLLSQNVMAKHDYWGWFWPAAFGESPLTSSHCSRDGVACPPAGQDPLFTSSHGAANWSFALDHDAAFGESPYYALAGVVFPDDTYLYGLG